MCRPFLFSLLVLLLVPESRGEVPALLQEVVDKLTDERQLWAFTQVVREFDGDRVAVERVERFDPARGSERRWLLISMNGRPPTPAEVETWSQRKNKVRKRAPKEVADYVDLERAQVREETGEAISYAVPFRRSAGGLFPGEKVDLTLTINKLTHALERAQVSIDESFRVALGLAQVVDLELDLEMPDREHPARPGVTAEKPQGSASAVVHKFGRRFEYQWSDFTRHESLPLAAR